MPTIEVMTWCEPINLNEDEIQLEKMTINGVDVTKFLDPDETDVVMSSCAKWGDYKLYRAMRSSDDPNEEAIMFDSMAFDFRGCKVHFFKEGEMIVETNMEIFFNREHGNRYFTMEQLQSDQWIYKYIITWNKEK